jgi:hypothetical protein
MKPLVTEYVTLFSVNVSQKLPWLPYLLSELLWQKMNSCNYTNVTSIYSRK